MPNSDEVFASLADAAIRLAYNNPSAYNPQNVSNALWAFAKAGRSHPQLYAALGPVGARIARNFSMQALANACDSVLETSVVVRPRRWRGGGRDLSEAAKPPRDELLGQGAVGPPSTPSTRWLAVVGAASR